MQDYIKITPDLDIHYSDLMMPIDLTQKFTLRDVIRAAATSTYIPNDVMKSIIQCNNIWDYYKEMESKPFEDKGNIEYLELCWIGDIHEDEEGLSPNYKYGSSWEFHGMGKLGVVGDDIKDLMTTEEIASFRQSYAVEMSPLYHLADYEIRIHDEIVVTDWTVKPHRGHENYKNMLKKLGIRPSITLIEVLYSVFWELSFFGSPEVRDEQKEELNKRVKTIEDAKKNGTLDKILIPWEEVKERLDKKIKDIQENNDKAKKAKEEEIQKENCKMRWRI